jgi:hypothetical protein
MSGVGTPSGWSAGIRTWLRSRVTKSRPRGRRRGGYPPAGSDTRSVRLGALLYLYRGSPVEPLQFRGELDADELDALADLTEDDMHLVNACLAVERELLDEEWGSVAVLLAGDMFGEEEADARLDEAMERDELGRIAGEVIALMQLGLLD